MSMPASADTPSLRDAPPVDRVLTGYDRRHLVTYLRLLDAEAEGADWREVAKLVLHLDPVADHDHARSVWESHLKRAKWMTDSGYRYLLEGDGPH